MHSRHIDIINGICFLILVACFSITLYLLGATMSNRYNDLVLHNDNLQEAYDDLLLKFEVLQTEHDALEGDYNDVRDALTELKGRLVEHNPNPAFLAKFFK